MTVQPRNPWLCVLIAACIGIVAVAGVVGTILVAMTGHDLPPSLVALAGAALGSLSSFLVSVPRGSIGNEEGSKPT